MCHVAWLRVMYVVAGRPTCSWLRLNGIISVIVINTLSLDRFTTVTLQQVLLSDKLTWGGRNFRQWKTRRDESTDVFFPCELCWHGISSHRVSVRPSVSPSVTSRSCTKMAIPRITLTTPGTLVFDAKNLVNIPTISPYHQYFTACMLYYCNMVGWAWWDWGLIWWLTILLQCFDTVGWVTWPVKISTPNDLYCVEWDVKP